MNAVSNRARAILLWHVPSAMTTALRYRILNFKRIKTFSKHMSWKVCCCCMVSRWYLNIQKWVVFVIFISDHMSQQALICVFQHDDNSRTIIRKYDSREPVDVILQHLRALGYLNVESLRSYNDHEFSKKEGIIPAGDYAIVNSSSSGTYLF